MWAERKSEKRLRTGRARWTGSNLPQPTEPRLIMSPKPWKKWGCPIYKRDFNERMLWSYVLRSIYLTYYLSLSDHWHERHLASIDSRSPVGTPVLWQRQWSTDRQIARSTWFCGPQYCIPLCLDISSTIDTHISDTITPHLSYIQKHQIFCKSKPFFLETSW